MAEDGEGAGGGLSAVAAEAAALEVVLADLEGLSERFGASLARALAGAVLEGRSLEAVLKRLALSLSGSILNQALAPLGGALSGALSSVIGGLFGGGAAVVPFATGGVVATPSYFPLGSGRLGLAGEAGAEAIIPLARGDDGRLGVRGGGGGGVSVVVNVTTPDAESFRRSEGQIAAMLARAAARGRRGL